MQQTLTAPFFEGWFFFFLRGKISAKISRQWFCGEEWAEHVSILSPNLFVDSFQWDKVNSIALDEAALYPETTAVFIVSDVWLALSHLAFLLWSSF